MQITVNHGTVTLEKYFGRLLPVPLQTRINLSGGKFVFWQPIPGHS